MHAQLLVSGLDTRTIRGMFINYWDRVNTNLDTSTFFLFYFLHVNDQSYGYTRPIAESIKRASPGGMGSTSTSQTLRQQVTMALMRLWPRQSFSMYTPFNRLHFIWHWTHLSYTYVQIISDATAMLLFHSAIPLTVCRAPCCSEFNTFNVNLSVITVCLPVVFELSWPRNLLKIVCAIDRLMPLKHCYHYVSFPVVI